MVISDLKKLVGKKLLWVGTDPENGFSYLLFENMNAIGIEECQFMDQGDTVMYKILNENISKAENIVELKVIMEAHKNGTQPAVSKEASGTASPSGSRG